MTKETFGRCYKKKVDNTGHGFVVHYNVNGTISDVEDYYGDPKDPFDLANYTHAHEQEWRLCQVDVRLHERTYYKTDYDRTKIHLLRR